MSLSIFTIYFLIKLTTFKLELIFSYLPVLTLIAFCQFIAYLSFYKGLSKSNVSLVSPIGATYSLVIVVLSTLIYKEVLNNGQILAIFLILTGIILTSVNLPVIFKFKKLTIFSGVKEGLVAMLGWGISLFLIVPVSQSLGWFLPAYIFKLIFLSFLLIYMLVKKQKIDKQKLKSNWLILIIIGVFDMVAFFSYSFGVMSEYASIVAPVAGAYSMITVVLGLVFLKEKLVFNQVVGILGIISGLVLISLLHTS
ncbi:MAG: hypothetical protein US11_C0001G0024 [Candidatus Roizmanbacteria bacterium GW2011_GWA2_36_23]|uniref:EamA domain-containing protein n=1 Tax=Candidatus Roizmanbacteria bacterium GW2011_GWA2_36_23 TaxID=1618480 RepID=A0A0G0ELU0_9BACT|nr:MAG: hypothetical protein US11_C0001G0024 [Candidatus Roizmanbacteria bacterium GW2011_GWA2_36_23]